jgi:hypothetical protein
MARRVSAKVVRRGTRGGEKREGMDNELLGNGSMFSCLPKGSDKAVISIENFLHLS